jgi:maleylacetoacetate isomerase
MSAVPPQHAAGKLRLYHYWRSSSSWRVRWALARKGISAEMIAVNLLEGASESPEHLKRNPMGYVPALETPGGKFIGESVAIIEWLEETHPAHPLLPRDLFLRARTRQLVEIVNSGTQPLQNLGVTEMVSEDGEKKKAWNQHWIRKGLDAYEILVKETAGKFAIGDEPTMADLFLIPQCYNASRNEIDLTEFPTIERINRAGLALESCQAAHPERYKPA